MKKLPFKPGDKVIIESKPREWSSGEDGRCGLGDVTYPYTFTVEKIGDHDTHIAIFDGLYGWTYSEDKFKKVGSSSKFAEARDEKVTILKRR